MTISTPGPVEAASESVIARRQLLLGDIREAFARKGNVPISSAELVKTLIALEGRPWGKASNPLTQIRLARMLAPMGIRPCQIGPEAVRVRGYKRAQFNGAFRSYRPPKNDPKPVDAPVMASAASVMAGANGGEQGLSDRRIWEHAEWCAERAYWHHSPAALAAGALDAELRAILRREVGPERVETEFDRVMRVMRSSHWLHQRLRE